MATWQQQLTSSARGASRSAIRAGAMATADARQFPDLIIIGVKRGGTTSLFRDLELHPAMLPLVPSARRLPLRENQKGVHYFDSHSDRSLRWYRSHFASTATHALRRRRTGESFTAEASPYYLFHPLAAQRTTDALPDALFVIMLRDPVERTISHWSEQTRNGVETLTLGEALEAEATRVGDDAERLRSGTLTTSDAHEQQSFAAQSEYADSLERWFEAAGRDRVLVTFSEDYYADAHSVLGPIAERLGITPFSSDVGAHRNAAPRPSEIDPAIEAALIERFRPDVERVSNLIGQPPPWPRFADTSAGGSADR